MGAKAERRFDRNRGGKPGARTEGKGTAHAFLMWIKRKPKKHRVLWRTGRVILHGPETTELRLATYEAASGRCSVCNEFAPWEGWKHGEMNHLRFKSRGGGDTPSNVSWLCHKHHSAAHGIREV